jgi:hypothetical protein
MAEVMGSEVLMIQIVVPEDGQGVSVGQRR